MTTEEQSRVSAIDLQICQLRRQRRVITGEHHDGMTPEKAATFLLALTPHHQDDRRGGFYIERAPLLALVQILEAEVRRGRRAPFLDGESRQARRAEVCT